MLLLRAWALTSAEFLLAPLWTRVPVVVVVVVVFVPVLSTLFWLA
jgi:predicted signal transduction protein with EAL and GGDEF domain